MNTIEHLLTVLGEEGGEVAKECSKANRFGLDDVNFLKPDGPSNRQNLVDELNDFAGVVELLVERGVLPCNWRDEDKVNVKKLKVLKCMKYAEGVGALQTGKEKP